jgi:septal ring-binding cell division protein DamX
MKTALATAAALIAAVAMLPTEVEAKSKHRRGHVHTSSAYGVTVEEPTHRRGPSRVVETHDTVRANAADPTHQYKLPDWARAAFETRGRR